MIDSNKLKNGIREYVDKYGEIHMSITRFNILLERSEKRGHWKGKPIAGYSTVRCSECGDVFRENSGKWNYCPNCGSKMDEVEE